MSGSKGRVASTLPPNWYYDPIHMDMVYERIQSLVARGLSDLDIARAVGCSDKTVFRYRHRGRPDPEKKPLAKVPDETVRDNIRLRRSNKWLMQVYGVSNRRAARIREELGLG